MDDVRAEALSASRPGCASSSCRQTATRHRRRGAGRARGDCRPCGDVLVLYADTPLLPHATLAQLRARLDDGAGMAVLGFEAGRSDRLRPSAHGRRRRLDAIREDKDASAAGAPRAPLQLRRHGLPLRRSARRPGAPSATRTPRANIYLTDAVEIARAGGGARRRRARASEDEVLGVNSREQLAVAEAHLPDARAPSTVMERGRDADRAGDGLAFATIPRSAATSSSSRTSSSVPA